MKLLIASDIHGSKYYCQKLIDVFRDTLPDKLVLLGDILYHGPRNHIPRDYSPSEVFDMLNGIAEHILAIRGNCDSEVDQMVLKFPMMADYACIFADGITMYCTHGHVYGEDNPPPLQGGEILLCGHTHVPKICSHTGNNGYTYINPGSVTIPKENSSNSYLVYENGVFTIKDFNGAELLSYKVK